MSEFPPVANNLGNEIGAFIPHTFYEGSAFRDDAARYNQLYSLPAHGFEDNIGAYHEAIEQITKVGLPIDNFTRFVRGTNEPGSGNEDVLASWGIGTENKGHFSIHELLDEQIPEKRLSTYIHENTHANTPLSAENSFLYGGEAERVEAEKIVIAVADQSLLTGQTLNGYHKYLAEQFTSGEIDYWTFAEETSAILSELALTNRKGLELVQERQHKEWDDLARINRIHGLPELPPKVDLLSSLDRRGVLNIDGVDKSLMRLLNISSYDAYIAHIGGLKQAFYPEETLVVAEIRFEDQNAEALARHGLFMRIMTEMAIRAAMEDEDKKDKQKQSL